MDYHNHYNGKSIMPPNSKAAEMVVLGCILTNTTDINPYYKTCIFILFFNASMLKSFENDEMYNFLVLCEIIDENRMFGALLYGIYYVTHIRRRNYC